MRLQSPATKRSVDRKQVFKQWDRVAFLFGRIVSAHTHTHTLTCSLWYNITSSLHYISQSAHRDLLSRRCVTIVIHARPVWRTHKMGANHGTVIARARAPQDQVCVCLCIYIHGIRAAPKESPGPRRRANWSAGDNHHASVCAPSIYYTNRGSLMA